MEQLFIYLALIQANQMQQKFLKKNRLLPVVELLLKNFPEIILSIDTFRSVVAKKQLILVPGMKRYFGRKFRSKHARNGQLQVPYIMMHEGNQIRCNR
jgi:dihydropteroate synthase